MQGIRGVGKTTTARIIAKTINCTNLNILGPAPIPCEECTNCLSFKNSSHPDILEIDAASRTGVDDVRVIIENSEYKPMMGKHKIFIIDEVHMLSKSAFNALLKLLEEPPAHCIFIFATTEVHKIPLTIISRCQRFDLARFSNESISNLLENICKLEQISISKEARDIIASKSDGSARDSLSLLDQARLNASSQSSSSQNSEITKELVMKMLSSVDHKIIIELIKAIISEDTEKALSTLSEFYETNSDFNIFITELLSLIAYIAKKLAITKYSSHEFHSYEEEISSIASQVDMTFAQIAWKLTYNTISDLKTSLNQLQNMEMLVLKLMYVLSSKADAINQSSVGANKVKPTSIIAGEDISAQKKTEKLALAEALIHSKEFKTAPEISYSEGSNTREFTGAICEELPITSSYPLPEHVITAIPVTRATDSIGLYDFESFLKYLLGKKEMQLFYDLFNNTELKNQSETEYLLCTLKPNSKFENEVRSSLVSWSDGKITPRFEYSNTLISYKEKIKQNISSTPIMQKISKNFPELEIVDILIQY